jgi:hypothetical protein
VKGIQVCTNRGPGPIFEGEIIAKNRVGLFKNLLQNPWTRIVQIYSETFLNRPALGPKNMAV